MTVTRERFEQGMTYAAYKEQMTRNRERIEENERTVTLDLEDVAYFQKLPEPLYVLVLAEDWCGDVVANLPVLQRLADASGKLTVRIFLRDQNPDLMGQYLKLGQFRSIPVFAFFDPDFQPIGQWFERPQRMTELANVFRRALFASDDLLRAYSPEMPLNELPEAPRERLIAGLSSFRTENRELADREVAREIRALIADYVAVNIRRLEDLNRRAGPAKLRADRQLKVSITYCSVCGYEPQTLALTKTLLYEFVCDLAAIELIPWQDGVFDVLVDGELVHSMQRGGGLPDPEAIVRLIRERLAIA